MYQINVWSKQKLSVHMAGHINRECITNSLGYITVWVSDLKLDCAIFEFCCPKCFFVKFSTYLLTVCKVLGLCVG